jgi:membrane protease YdiL (CAAX protease family)
VWLLFGLLILGGLFQTLSQASTPEKKYTTEELTLRQAVLMMRVADLSPTMADQLKDGFAKVLEEVREDARTKPAAARIYLAANQESGKRPPPEYLSTLLRSKDPQDRALAQLYASEKLSDGAAKRLLSQIEGTSFTFQLAKVHAREKAGMQPTGRDVIAPLWKVVATGGVMLIFLGVATLGVGLWVAFFALRSTGQIRALGFPSGEISRGLADKMALRAAQIMGAFLLLGLLADRAAALIRTSADKTVDNPILNVVPSIGILVFVLLVQRASIAGHKLTLASIGLSKERLGINFVWGVCAFAAELPLTIAMGLIGQKLFSFLPPPEHPASTMLQNRPDFGVVISILVFGALIAPFWEEIVFRGLLFPAVSKVTTGPVVGALITSFLFAAIHPQGPSTWLALGSIAAVSCALAYHTKSLVPSIVMHAIHNFALMAGTLIIF